MIDPAEKGPLVKTLLDIPLFEGLDYIQIGELIDIGSIETPTAGQILCKSRTIDENLVILLEGTLYLESADGDFLDDLHAVRVIGEMGVFTGQVRSSQVLGTPGAKVMLLPAVELEELLEEDPQLAHHLFSSLIKLLYTRLHDVNNDMAALRNRADLLRGRVEELSPDDPLLAELFPEE
ncbi:MAG: cyclic nucleotide-binding domain-containing protein [Candidatus Latescibacteria bacterium]|jgi:signal-transduction protein with cAMP-binding, CBS, and nucleotidyltransferase domain|nr:cyclic nucleotide-binding domain-containing protein [Candidatus Latescibacterota bacterium]